MKKNLIYLILFLVLAALAYFYVLRNSGSTLDRELSDFSVMDTGKVVKIFMADKSGAHVTLRRESPGEWTVNGSNEARPDAMRTLLETIRMVDVRSPVARSAYNNVIKQLAANAVKVEIYTGEESLLKTYYVGGPTQDQLGTFMLIDGSDVPFVTHIPGFDGYLTPRYIVKESEWRTKRVFKLTPDEISRVRVLDRSRDNYIMTIEKKDDGGFIVMDGNDVELPGVSEDKVLNYLSYYSFINYEMGESTLTAVQLDSLTSTTPFRELSLTRSDGDATNIEFWRRPITASTVHKTNAAGKEFPFDVDRMVARLNGDTALIVVQYYTFDKLFRSPADLMTPLN
jgi:hypothetical protein